MQSRHSLLRAASGWVPPLKFGKPVTAVADTRRWPTIRTYIRYGFQNGNWLCRSPLDNLSGSFRQQRTGGADRGCVKTLG